MSTADQEYLMQVEDREAVVKTLQAKLIEREQLYEDDYGEEDQQDDQYSEDQEPIDIQDDRQKLGLVHKNFKM